VGNSASTLCSSRSLLEADLLIPAHRPAEGISTDGCAGPGFRASRSGNLLLDGVEAGFRLCSSNTRPVGGLLAQGSGGRVLEPIEPAGP